MNFIEKNEGKNIKIQLIDSGNLVAKATCYFEDTPVVNEENIGCIGEFSACNKNYGMAVVRRCEEILREKGTQLVVAPMNGNTWKEYRALKYNRGDDMFLLENVNPLEDNYVLLDSGYHEMNTYTSTKGLIEDGYNIETLRAAEENMASAGITIRKFNKENSYWELQKIYNVAKESFASNLLYKQISVEEFINQYIPYIQMVDEDFVLLVEKDGKEIGYVFGVPDFNELKNGKKLETLVLKNIAILPEYENLALENILLTKIANVAKYKNFKNWIFAFMEVNNVSKKIAEKCNAKIIREYSIYKKELQ